MTGCRSRHQSVLVPVIALGLLALSAAGVCAAASVPVVGAREHVLFDHAVQACATWDIPDTPARAWRSADGQVNLVAGAAGTRASRGPDFATLRRVCPVLLEGARDPEPSARDDLLWIASVHTLDGRRVEALVHLEYHGHRHPGACFSDNYQKCWRSAVLAATSIDGGRSFTLDRTRPVAALPYIYNPAQQARSGYFGPSNMLRRGDHLYAFVFATRYGVQQRGVCLMRRPLTGGAADWRAWDGEDFTIRFADPYRETVIEPERHVCTPLPRLGATLRSVVRQGDRYIATFSKRDGVHEGRQVTGFWARTSRDLIDWSDPVLLLEVPLLWARDCAAPYLYAYPSLIDPDSPSLRFDTVGDTMWLTYTRMRLDTRCEPTAERDLVRRKLTWPEG